MWNWLVWGTRLCGHRRTDISGFGFPLVQFGYTMWGPATSRSRVVQFPRGSLQGIVQL